MHVSATAAAAASSANNNNTDSTKVNGTKQPNTNNFPSTTASTTTTTTASSTGASNNHTSDVNKENIPTQQAAAAVNGQRTAQKNSAPSVPPSTKEDAKQQQQQQDPSATIVNTTTTTLTNGMTPVITAPTNQTGPNSDNAESAAATDIVDPSLILIKESSETELSAQASPATTNKGQESSQLNHPNLMSTSSTSSTSSSTTTAGAVSNASSGTTTTTSNSYRLSNATEAAVNGESGLPAVAADTADPKNAGASAPTQTTKSNAPLAPTTGKHFFRCVWNDHFIENPNPTLTIFYGFFYEMDFL